MLGPGGLFELVFMLLGMNCIQGRMEWFLLGLLCWSLRFVDSNCSFVIDVEDDGFTVFVSGGWLWILVFIWES